MLNKEIETGFACDNNAVVKMNPETFNMLIDEIHQMFKGFVIRNTKINGWDKEQCINAFYEAYPVLTNIAAYSKIKIT